MLSTLFMYISSCFPLVRRCCIYPSQYQLSIYHDDTESLPQAEFERELSIFVSVNILFVVVKLKICVTRNKGNADTQTDKSFLLGFDKYEMI